MKKFAFLIFIICFFTTFATAQKTVRKRPKTPSVQTKENQTSSGTNRNTNENDLKHLNQNQSKSSQFFKPLKILEKPRASYPSQDKGTICAQGKVVLRVTFLFSGEIGSISVISGMGNGLTEQAIEAAKKIKFEPAMKNGKPVTVTKPVEYIFSIY